MPIFQEVLTQFTSYVNFTMYSFNVSWDKLPGLVHFVQRGRQQRLVHIQSIHPYICCAQQLTMPADSDMGDKSVDAGFKNSTK